MLLLRKKRSVKEKTLLCNRRKGYFERKNGILGKKCNFEKKIFLEKKTTFGGKNAHFRERKDTLDIKHYF